MAVILYARVSTAEQNIEHQLGHAKAAGFTIDEVIAAVDEHRNAGGPREERESSFRGTPRALKKGGA